MRVLFLEECKFIQLHDLNKLPPDNDGRGIENISENNNNFITLWHVNTDLELEVKMLFFYQRTFGLKV